MITLDSANHKRVRVTLSMRGLPSKTHQSMADACDVNTIVGKFTVTGFASHVNAGEYQFGDFSSAGDFQNQMDRIAEAKTQFESLPVRLRSKVNHDPTKIMDYMADPKNRDELVEMGVLEKVLAAPGQPNPEALKEETKTVPKTAEPPPIIGGE